jgi:AraC family transcriptional regulator
MKTPTQQTYRQRILCVQLFIEEHLDEELPLDRLARVAHFSVHHFHRVFKALVGEPVREHVRRLRLEAAAVALKTTPRSVLEVALESGYGSHESFSRAFRQMFGVSPSEFRDGHNPTYSKKEMPAMTAPLSIDDVRIEKYSPRCVAFLRHIGPFDTVEPTFQRLLAWAGQHNLFRADSLVIGMCLDDPDVTPADRIRFDCCVTVGDEVKPEGEIGVQTIAGGEHAIVTHRGPYNRLHEVYRWLYGVWLPTSGREPGDAPPFEVYRNSPDQTQPDDLVTDICVPLESR